jgi:hypothetical protein
MAVNHTSEDLTAEAKLDEVTLGHALAVKMLAKVEKDATENGYTAVLDVGAPKNQVLLNNPARPGQRFAELPITNIM